VKETPQPEPHSRRSLWCSCSKGPIRGGNNAVLGSQKLLKITWKNCGQFLPREQLEAAAQFEKPNRPHDWGMSERLCLSKPLGQSMSD